MASINWHRHNRATTGEHKFSWQCCSQKPNC